ncbi:GNAT family N-acetyltransferase [Sulfurospirillum sp. 1612]|uniref:GNAT family N-acetyltransferase n=1 Tax=Sulfurospirillum sp. 1612 TaxID=3094835 RepID=UPI002F94959E
MIKQFRVAKIEDLPEIINIYNDSINDGITTLESAIVTVESRVDWFHSHDKETRPILVKEYRDKIISWIDFQPFDAGKAYQNCARINIYIERNFRGQKLGQKFLQEALAKAKEYGIKTLLAYIFADNIASLKLFKKMNFREWGRFPSVAEFDDTQKDLIILGRAIETV